MARAAQATIQAHGGVSGRGGGGASSAGGGGSASSSSARTSAVMRSVCVSTPGDERAAQLREMLAQRACR